MEKRKESGRKVFVMGCAGAANVGQVSNRAAAELVGEGFARPFCLAGIGAHLKAFLKGASDADNIVIDGCAMSCGRTILEHAGLSVACHFVVTDLGIEKKMSPFLSEEDVAKVKEAVRSRRESGETGEGSLPEGSSCDCSS
jgi:uncharacterized metal-binding protein